MNTTSENLFLLIHSLRKSEKRSFKLSAALDKKEKQYITIFDLIARQKAYDEDAILKKLQMKKNVFAVSKNHLYHLLLERMAVLHSSKETALRKVLTQADFLHSKGLYPLFEKMLARAKKLATQYDMDHQLLEILNMEHRNAWRKRDLPRAASVVEEDKETLKRLTNQRQYTHLSNEIIIAMSTGDNRDIREVNKLKELLKNPLIRNEKNALTFRSKYSLYHTLSLYYSMVEDPDKQYHFAKKATELYESRPEKIKYDTYTYLLSLHLMLVACHTLKKYDEAKKYADKLRIDSSFLTHEQEKIWAFFTFHDTNLNYYIKTGRFQEGIAPAERLAEELTADSPKLEGSHNLILDFHMARIYFGAGNYGKCLYRLNKILNEKHSFNIRQGLESNIKLLYIIVHFEKGNYDLLPSLSKSARNDLSEKGILFEFENTLLDFFARKIDTKEKQLRAFQQLKTEVDAIVKKEKMPFEEFDFLAWIESKTGNRTFADIVRKKIERN